MTAGEGQWATVASTWDLIGSPLRPVPTDIDAVRAAVDGWHEGAGRAPRALVLGVTPELHGMGWPEGTVVHALDHTQRMIDEIWPGPLEHAHLGEWTDLPFPDAAYDVVVCDGGWHLLEPRDQGRVLARLAAVLAPGGRFVTRLFVPPATASSPGEVLDAARAGRIADLNQLKLLLGNALMPSRDEGVVLHDLWRYLRDRWSDWSAMAGELGWDEARLRAIDAYEGKTARYHFTTLAELAEDVDRQPGLALGAVDVPAYPLGDLCPTVVVERAT